MAKKHMLTEDGSVLCGMRIPFKRKTANVEDVTCKLCLSVMEVERNLPWGDAAEPAQDKDRDWTDPDTVHGTLSGAIICNTRVEGVKTSKWLEEVTCRSCRQHSYFKSMEMMPDEVARQKGLRNTN